MIILHYIPSIDESSGGLGAYMQKMSRDLGLLTDLHVVTHHTKNELKLENTTIHYMGQGWLPWNSTKDEFLSILNKVKPDIFHANSCWLPIPSFTVIWAKKNGYKVIYTPHGMLEPYAIARRYWKKLPAILLFQKRSIALCDLLHATSIMEKENLINLKWNNNVEVIPNCVRIDEIMVKNSWKLTKNILFLSRVHPKKGIDLLIKAVVQLKDHFTDYTIKIVGPGDEFYINKLKLFALKNGVGDIFEFLGPVFGNEKWQLFQSSDLFILPSHSENFGIVVPEALASGTPVITTLNTPWRELNDLNCGWCVELGIDPLADAISDFFKCSEKKLEKMGKIGRKLVEDKYSSKTIAKHFVNMYKGQKISS